MGSGVGDVVGVEVDVGNGVGEVDGDEVVEGDGVDEDGEGVGEVGVGDVVG